MANASATFSRYVMVDSNEFALAHAVAIIGPISTTIDATQKSFRFYGEGIYEEPACNSKILTHGVTVIGYNDDYWKVKNSWSTDWGEQGYIKIARNKDNMCGIASQAFYPVV